MSTDNAPPERILDVTASLDGLLAGYSWEMEMLQANAEHDDRETAIDPDAVPWVDTSAEEIVYDEIRGQLLTVLIDRVQRAELVTVRDIGTYLRTFGADPDVRNAGSLADEAVFNDALAQTMRDAVACCARRVQAVLEHADLLQCLTEEERRQFQEPTLQQDDSPDGEHGWYADASYREDLLRFAIERSIVLQLQIPLRGYEPPERRNDDA